MKMVKITVLKCAWHPDLVEKYASPGLVPCDYHQPGQVYYTIGLSIERLSSGRYTKTDSYMLNTPECKKTTHKKTAVEGTIPTTAVFHLRFFCLEPCVLRSHDFSSM